MSFLLSLLPQLLGQLFFLFTGCENLCQVSLFGFLSLSRFSHGPPFSPGILSIVGYRDTIDLICPLSGDLLPPIMPGGYQASKHFATELHVTFLGFLQGSAWISLIEGEECEFAHCLGKEPKLLSKV